MNKILLSLFVIICSSCAAEKSPVSVVADQATEPCPKSGSCQISLVSVIATPNEFNGREIRSIGYLVPKGIETRLYLDRESAEHRIDDRAVLLVYDDKYSNTQRMFMGPPRYVSVLGLFSDGIKRKGGVHDSFVEAGTLVPIFPPTAVNSSQ